MARIDFYLLSNEGQQQRRFFACRLAEKAYRLNNTVHIHVLDHAEAEQLDEMLWTFRDGSFVPHELVAINRGNHNAPISIGCGDANVEARDLLINLCDGIPPFAETFPRVAELVTSDEACKRESRKRFAAYRDSGHDLETHNV